MIFMEINVSVYIQIHCVRRRESLMMPALVPMSHYSSPVHSQFKLHSQRHHCQAQDHPRLRYPGEHLPWSTFLHHHTTMLCIQIILLQLLLIKKLDECIVEMNNTTFTGFMLIKLFFVLTYILYGTLRSTTSKKHQIGYLTHFFKKNFIL